MSESPLINSGSSSSSSWTDIIKNSPTTMGISVAFVIIIIIIIIYKYGYLGKEDTSKGKEGFSIAKIFANLAEKQKKILESL